MLYYIKKYPVSLVIILAVIYLSFFKPPTTELGTIQDSQYRQGGAYLYVFRHVRYVVAGILAGASERPHAYVARMGRGICLPGIVQWSGRTVTGILYYLPRR